MYREKEREMRDDGRTTREVERRTPGQHKQVEPILRHRDHPRELRLRSIPAVLRGCAARLGSLVLRRCRVGDHGRIGRGGSVLSSAHPSLLVEVFEVIRTAEVLWMGTRTVRGSGSQQSSERLQSLVRRSQCCCISTRWGEKHSLDEGHRQADLDLHPTMCLLRDGIFMSAKRFILLIR